MTAKQALVEYVAALSEDDAERLWNHIQSDSPRPLSRAERDAIQRGLDDVRSGRTHALEDVVREFGLA